MTPKPLKEPPSHFQPLIFKIIQNYGLTCLTVDQLFPHRENHSSTIKNELATLSISETWLSNLGTVRRQLNKMQLGTRHVVR